MTEQLQVLRLVTNRLETAEIPYMLSGSLAMNYYGEPRMTRDIDLVVSLHLPDVDRMFALFKDDFYCDEEAMRRAILRRTLFNLIHFELVVKVDVIVQQDDTYRRTEFARRQRIALDDIPVWIVAIEDLVLSKLVWAKKGESALQLADVHNLVSSGRQIDWAYLEQWAAELTVTQLSNRCGNNDQSFGHIANRGRGSSAPNDAPIWHRAVSHGL